MQKTSIEWTHRPGTVGMTWNPIRARLKGQGPKVRTGTFCTKISPGCANCYASAINKRFGTGLAFTVPNLEQHEFVLDERFLAQPMHQKKPATIFVGDMFDLWHEAIPAEMIAEVLRVALKTPRHTFQFLTKRAERMQRTVNFAQEHWGVKFGEHMWFGVSIEDQQRADERLPFLEQTRATVRFLSVEPMLEEIWIEPHLLGQTSCGRSNWVICGGESGPGARPFNLAWAENLKAQCLNAGTAFFMKQIGSLPVLKESEWSDKYSPMRGLAAEKRYWLKASHDKRTPSGCVPLLVKDSKGGNIAEWPESLRVREFPASQKAEAVPA